ncbi:MAG: tyrosine recombinase [Clostridia bacterium]
MKAFLKEYESFLKETLSENTVSSYMGDIYKFTSEMNLKKPKELSKVTKTQLEEYIILLKSRGNAYSSISRTIASLKKFYGYCVDRGIVHDNIAFNMETPKQKRKLPDTLSMGDVEKLLNSPKGDSVKGMRDKAMLEVMYATGARVSELISLKVSDVSLKNEMVMLSSGKNHRFVPIGKIASNAVVDYLRFSRKEIHHSNESDVLFLNFYGNPLTRQGFWKIVKYYINKSGIKGNITPQTLRHSFALHLLTNGADMDSVSEMLGYSDSTSAKIYIEVMNNKIKEVYRKAHPRA